MIGGETGIRTLDTLLTYAGFDQRHPAFDPAGAKGVKMCSRHIFQDQPPERVQSILASAKEDCA